MIRLGDCGVVETSFAEFEHSGTGHKVGYLSCQHFGPQEYFVELQNTIDGWDGLIFEERISATAEEREKYKTGTRKFCLIKKVEEVYSIMGPALIAQRGVRGLVYPEGRTITSDIPLGTFWHLADFVNLPTPPEEPKRILMERALCSFPDASRVIIWKLLECALQEFEKYTQLETEPFTKLLEFLDLARDELLCDSRKRDFAGALGFDEFVQAVIGEFLYECLWNIIPERDTYALMQMDMHRGKSSRPHILFVYGAGHYPGIVRGLYERGYCRTTLKWHSANAFPQYSNDQFFEALGTLVSTYSTELSKK